MFQLNEKDRLALFHAVAQAPGVEAVGSIYGDFEAARRDREPRCDQSGRCCQFETFGHRLFVSTLELAYFRDHRVDEAAAEGWDGTGCPYQKGGLCSVHRARPFGCRVYFCDPTADEWQKDQYESFHRRIRELHDQQDVPYWYVEWRQALAILGVTPEPKGRTGRFPLPVVNP